MFALTFLCEYGCKKLPERVNEFSNLENLLLLCNRDGKTPVIFLKNNKVTIFTRIVLFLIILLIFLQKCDILNMPNQLNILSKGYFYLYGIVIPFCCRAHNRFCIKCKFLLSVATIRYSSCYFSWFGDYRSLRF